MIYKRYKILQKYVKGEPQDIYKSSDEVVDERWFDSLEECQGWEGDDINVLRWVLVEGEYICELNADGTYSKYQKYQRYSNIDGFIEEYIKGELLKDDVIDFSIEDCSDGIEWIVIDDIICEEKDAIWRDVDGIICEEFLPQWEDIDEVICEVSTKLRWKYVKGAICERCYGEPQFVDIDEYICEKGNVVAVDTGEYICELYDKIEFTTEGARTYVITYNGISKTINADEMTTTYFDWVDTTSVPDLFGKSQLDKPYYIKTDYPFPILEDATDMFNMVLSDKIELHLPTFKGDRIITAEKMFAARGERNTVPVIDLPNFTGENIEKAYMMFYGSDIDLNTSLPNLSLHKLKEVNSMFSNYVNPINFENVLGKKVSFGNTEHLYGLFRNSTGINGHLDLSSFKPKENINHNMLRLCEGCTNVESVDLSGIPYNSMNYRCEDMFANCTSLKEVNLGGINSISEYEGMFSNCNSLEKITCTHFVYDFYKKNYTNWGSTEPDQIEWTFIDHFEDIDEVICEETTNTQWDETDGVICEETDTQWKDVNGVICEETTDKESEFKFVDTDGVICEETTDTEWLPVDTSLCEEIKQLTFNNVEDEFICSLQGKNEVTNASGMFRGNTSSHIDISDYNFSKLTNASTMFFQCTNLEGSIDMSDAFREVPSLTSINASSMFAYCEKIKEIDLSGLGEMGTRSDLSFMFDGCKNLERVNLSNLVINTSQSIERAYSYMFGDCINLKEIVCKREFYKHYSNNHNNMRNGNGPNTQYAPDASQITWIFTD